MPFSEGKGGRMAFFSTKWAITAFKKFICHSITSWPTLLESRSAKTSHVKGLLKDRLLNWEKSPNICLKQREIIQVHPTKKKKSLCKLRAFTNWEKEGTTACCPGIYLWWKQEQKCQFLTCYPTAWIRKALVKLTDGTSTLVEDTHLKLCLGQSTCPGNTHIQSQNNHPVKELPCSFLLLCSHEEEYSRDLSAWLKGLQIYSRPQLAKSHTAGA